MDIMMQSLFDVSHDEANKQAAEKGLTSESLHKEHMTPSAIKALDSVSLTILQGMNAMNVLIYRDDIPLCADDFYQMAKQVCEDYIKRHGKPESLWKD
jgi:hypothetical protein